MRPKDLKFPYHPIEAGRLQSKGKVQYTLWEGVLIVPDGLYQTKEPIDTTPLFEGKETICIEYGCGNGDWIIQRAKESRNSFFIGVEKRLDRVRKIWSKMHNFEIGNLLIVLGMGEEFTQYYLPKNILSKAFINFPDPWPKEKHKDKRLVRPSFIETLSKVVKPQGELILATDSTPYRDQMVEVLENSPVFSSRFEAPYYRETLEGYGDSWFENLWREKGRGIYYLCYEK